MLGLLIGIIVFFYFLKLITTKSNWVCKFDWQFFTPFIILSVVCGIVWIANNM